LRSYRLFFPLVLPYPIVNMSLFYFPPRLVVKLRFACYYPSRPDRDASVSPSRSKVTVYHLIA
jgi:hypothetical protein